MRCASSPRRRTQLGPCELVNCSLQLLRILACPFQGIRAYTGKGEELSWQRRWEQRRSKLAPVEGLVWSQSWRGERPCSSVCPTLPATALLLQPRHGRRCPAWFGSAAGDRSKARCAPTAAPSQRDHTPRGSPVGLRQGQNFGMAVGEAWQGCAGWLLGQVAFGLEYEHCVALLKP